jgi:fatty acid desaturase
MVTKTDRIEWPTLALAAVTYGLWGAGLYLAPGVSLWLAIPLVAWTIAQHSSLTHEVIHGHPFADRRLNEALVFPALALVVPFRRFRDTHLAHHNDAILTDPYDDPESNYQDPKIWSRLPRWTQRLLNANNTLAGRLILGPAMGQVMWMRGDLALIRAGDTRVRDGWIWHIPAVMVVFAVVLWSPMPLWAYLVAAYLGLSLLKLRTFLEHRADVSAPARTVVIEDRGPFALLFLNNNLHVVHHMHPRTPWYRLPQLYRANPERYLGRNGGYRYRSYAEVFRRYVFTAKDPVPHPLLPD